MGNELKAMIDSWKNTAAPAAAGFAALGATASAQAQAAPQNAFWICPNCGSQNAGKFCTGCGAKKE